MFSWIGSFADQQPVPVTASSSCSSSFDFVARMALLKPKWPVLQGIMRVTQVRIVWACVGHRVISRCALGQALPLCGRSCENDTDTHMS